MRNYEFPPNHPENGEVGWAGVPNSEFRILVLTYTRRHRFAFEREGLMQRILIVVVVLLVVWRLLAAIGRRLATKAPGADSFSRFSPEARRRRKQWTGGGQPPLKSSSNVSHAAPSYRPAGRFRTDSVGSIVLKNADPPQTSSRSMIWGDSRDQMVAVGERLAAAELVRFSEGNLSVRVDESRVLVTPTGSDLGRLGPSDLVEVQLETSLVPPRATSEVHLHLEIYRRRVDVMAIVHAHPPQLLRLDARGELPHSRVIEDRGRMLGRVVSAAHFQEGSLALAEAAASALARHNACLLCGHGAVTLGSTLMRAFVRMLDFERAASLTPTRG